MSAEVEREQVSEHPKNVGILPAEALWSAAVKERDRNECVVCGEQEELSVKQVDSQPIRKEDGLINLSSGITLCTSCGLRYENEPKFRTTANAHLDRILEQHKTVRLNTEVNRELYVKFMALCKFRGITVSKAIRAFVLKTIIEAEVGYDSQ